MDPDYLTLLDQWLAGASPQGGTQPPTGDQLPAAAQNGQAEQQVDWPDTWIGPNSQPTPQDYADALEKLYGNSGSQAASGPTADDRAQASKVGPAADDLTGAQDPAPASDTAPTYAGGAGALQLSDGVYRNNGDAPSLTQVGYGSGQEAATPTQSSAIADADRLYGDAARVASDLNSKSSYGNFDTPTAQRAFDQTNAAIDRTVAALQNSNDPNAQAAIMRLNSIGAYMAKQAWQAGLQGTATQSQDRFMRDLGGDAGKDAVASAFGEEFAN